MILNPWLKVHISKSKWFQLGKTSLCPFSIVLIDCYVTLCDEVRHASFLQISLKSVAMIEFVKSWDWAQSFTPHVDRELFVTLFYS